MRYQPQRGHVELDPALRADFSWVAPVGVIRGPAVKAVSSTSQIVTADGIGIATGYAELSGPVASLSATTWTEFGVIHLDAENPSDLPTLSARAAGQTVHFSPARPGRAASINLVMWGRVDLPLTAPYGFGIIHYAVRRFGSTHSIWLNGRFYGSASSSTQPLNPSVLPAIGAQAASGQYTGVSPLIGRNSVLAVTRTPLALSDAQCLALSGNAWQAFLDPDDDDYAGPASAQQRVIVVEGAALAMAGGPVRMIVSRRIPVASAALALGAGHVLVHASRRLAVDRAALTLAAGPVAILAGRRLVVQPSALQLAGRDVGMRTARRMSVAQTALTLTGGQVEMLYAAKEVPGSYTLPVSAATMTVGFGEMRMRVSRRLVVTPARIDLGLGAVRALAGRRLLVSHAALAVGAAPVGLVAHRRLPVGAVALALAPGGVTLRYSSQIDYSRAPAGPGYAPQRVTVQARPAQTGGYRPPATQETIR